MPIVKFEFDPDAPLGSGNATDETGKTTYVYDPETAARFIPLMPGKTLKPATPAPGAAPAATPAPGSPAATPAPAEPAVAPEPPPAAVPEAAPAAPEVPGATDRTRDLLTKLNSVTGQLPKPKGTVLAQRTVQQGADPTKAAARAGAALDTAQETGEAVKAAGEARTATAQQQADIGIKAAEGDISRATGEIVGQGRVAQEAEQRRLAVELEKDPEINQGRLTENLGTGKTIAMIILAALNGGFGAQIGARENGVITVWNDAIEKDIAAQKAQIESGRIRRGNLIQHYKEKGYDARKAEEAARAALKMAIGRKTELEAARLGATEHTEAAKLEAQKIYAQGQQQALALDQAADPVVQDTFAQPKPTGGKGMDLKQLLELDKALESSGYTREQRAEFLARAGVKPPKGASAAELKREDDERKRKEDEKKASAAEGKQTEKEALAEGAMAGIKEIAIKAGLVRDKEGKWTAGDGILPPAVYENIASTVTLGTTSTPIKDALDAGAEAYGRYRSGGVISDDSERPAFYDQMGANTTTRAQLASKLNAAEATIGPTRPMTAREQPKGVPASWK